MSDDTSKEVDKVLDKKTEEVKKTKKKIGIVPEIIFVVAILVAAYYFFGMQPEATIYSELELQKFQDLVGSNNTVNVEIWLKNTGNEKSIQISILARARDQNGELLFDKEIEPTTKILLPGDTCTAYYVISIQNETTYVFHTIEVRWGSRRLVEEFTTSFI